MAQQQVTRQTRLYHDKVAPGIKPIAVEEHLKAEIEDGFVLSGHVDVTEEFDLHDLKTGKNQRRQSGSNTGPTHSCAARMVATQTS